MFLVGFWAFKINKSKLETYSQKHIDGNTFGNTFA